VLSVSRGYLSQNDESKQHSFFLALEGFIWFLHRCTSSNPLVLVWGLGHFFSLLPKKQDSSVCYITCPCQLIFVVVEEPFEAMIDLF